MQPEGEVPPMTDPVALPTLPRVPLPVTLDEAGVCEFFGVEEMSPCDAAEGESIYVMRDRTTGLLKIGRSVDAQQRADDLCRRFGLDLELVLVAPGGRIRERLLHRAFDAQRVDHPLVDGDGFPMPGLPDEWFTCEGKLAEAVKGLAA